ncbi:MAG: hypothetical protein AAF675_17005, partial [Pseudomonadota bacterium]
MSGPGSTVSTSAGPGSERQRIAARQAARPVGPARLYSAAIPSLTALALMALLPGALGETGGALTLFWATLATPWGVLAQAMATALGTVFEGLIAALSPLLPTVLGLSLGAVSALPAVAAGPVIDVLSADPRLARPLRAEGATPVSGMRGLWGLVTAYWTSERWVEAWTLSAAVIALTTLLSKASVWVAMASADFLSALVNAHAASAKGDPLGWILTAGAVYAAIALGRIGGVALRHFASSTLHRKARRWTQGAYQAALLRAGHVPANLMSDRGGIEEGVSRLPDNIDQRVDECTESVFGAVIGLAMGLWGAIASVYFVSVALLERSAPVPFLDDAAARTIPALAPGEYGSFVLVVLLVCTYVPLMTWIAWRLGRVLERQTLARQRADGSWRGELGQMLARAPRLAISRGEAVQARLNGRLYGRIDAAWHRLNGTQSGFMAFTNGTTFITNRLIGYLPALPAYLSGAISFKTYAASSELVAELINDSSWFVQVMPALATLKANTGRLTELAQAIEAAGDNRRFYAATGRHDFTMAETDARFGLRLSELALCHRGHDAKPFLRVPGLAVRPGRWAYVRGQNGAGKSCLLKAVMGLWPYGEGLITRPAGTALFAGQEP